MIDYNEAVAVTREQLALAERALRSLRRSIKNPGQLAVFSEAYIDQIAALKADIRKYSALAKKANTKSKRSPVGKHKKAG